MGIVCTVTVFKKKALILLSSSEIEFKLFIEGMYVVLLNKHGFLSLVVIL
jgi:hypothetical protein